MKQKLVIVVIAVVALGAGFAGGFVFANKKSNTVVADMQTKMQQSEAASRARISNYDNIVNRLSGELQIARLEIEGFKTQGVQPQAAEEPQRATQQSTTISRQQPQQQTEMPDGPTDGVAQGNTRTYTIQSGDSLWSIAQKQLGNGSRFNEILKLNPKLTAKSNLVVGSRLKLPAK
ncbi:MAG: LysM peptidoglycan-binding domain-containing protein [Planctomycetaceae bacterium]|nr:LysM peptidoglycan-binding domain-containing protein [Planctomycetaceae bacterium]